MTLSIDSSISKQVENLYKRANKEDEFEFIFYKTKKLSADNYLRLLEYLNARSKINKLDINKYVTLDITFSKGANNYRITITGLESIDKYIDMLYNRKNHVVFNILSNIALSEKSDPSVKIMKKVKQKSDIVDIDSYDIRVRLSRETDLTKEDKENINGLTDKDIDKIKYRYKQRTSLFFEKDVCSIDLTNVKMGNNISTIDKMPPNYELEIDYSKKSNNKDLLPSIYLEATRLLKVVQQSPFLITINKEKEVLDYYCNLVGAKRDITTLMATSTTTLEIQHIIHKLVGKYAVTDKADGVRTNLVIFNNHVYLIDYNLHVKDTGIILSDKLSKYNGSILDGELIFIKQQNRYVFMTFNCLFSKNNDVRTNEKLMDRLKEADDIIENCFILGNQKGFKFNELSDNFNIDNILSFYKKQLIDSMDSLNHDIKLEKTYTLVRRKVFFPVLGIQDNEIFKYASMLWGMINFDKSIECPYTLDGLIYQPLNQKYTTVEREVLYNEYKWKPPEMNSIDFYIVFQKNRNTGEQLILYDNSNDDYVRNKPYKVAHLHVYITDKMGNHHPELFQKEDNKYIANIFIEDGHARDKEGNILQDKTVVEFYYNTDITIPERHRWIPLRTRHDKTEYVQRYGKKYGNYRDIANKNWRSIAEPILFNDYIVLSKDDQYLKHVTFINSKIGNSIVLSERQESAYFQKTHNLAIPMKHFNDWIKSITYYTYFNGETYEGKNFSILDLGTVGEDLMKFYYGRISFYLGIDIDNNNLISPVNGTISRAKQFARKHPNFPPMVFINADPGAPLTLDDQLKILGTTSTENINNMKKYFNKNATYDRINCPVYLPFMLENEVKWNNFLQNINWYLKPGGQVVFIARDAERTMDLLKDTDKYTVNYTNKIGEEFVFFEIIKQYSDTSKNIGLGIDVHFVKTCQEGKYITEFLVKKDFLVEELDKKCDMVLVETDLYENQFNIDGEFINKYGQYEEKPETNKFMQSVTAFYDMEDSMNRVSFEMVRLQRFYVFQKRDSGNITSETSTTSSTSLVGPDKKSTQKKPVTKKPAAKKSVIKKPTTRKNNSRT